MSKNLTVFETTYEKVLSILNKIKDFIINNTKDNENIIKELEWIKTVIANKSLYSYEVNKSKLSSDNLSNQKFLDFINKYNEEIINLNKKHVLVRDILTISKNKEMLKKPSLILKRISVNEINKDNSNEKSNKSNKESNPLGNWVMNLYLKNKEENANNNSHKKLSNSYKKIDLLNEKNSSNKNKKEYRPNSKSISIFKNETPLKDNSMKLNSSLSAFNENKNKNIFSEIIKSSQNQKSKEKNKKNNLDLNKRISDLTEVKKAMERYYLRAIEEKNKKINLFAKKLMEKKEHKKNNNNKSFTKRTKNENSNLNNLIEKNFDFMKTITERDFNIFKLKKLVGYKNVLPLMCHFIFKLLGLIDPKIIVVKKFSHFLNSISQGYLETTLYHNSLHGADVCHSLFLYIINSNIEEICQTSILDLLGLMISASGHDLGHPGYNNNFQVNSGSDLALIYNDISCLENYHASTLFKILRKDENNIFEKMEIDDSKKIRKRMINQILATDMINHAMVLSSVKAKITEFEKYNDINNENKNKKFVFLSGEEKTKFDEQQMMLNYLIHAADLGHNTKKFEISIKWVELLTQEFWKQGDIEKEKKLNISFLCDRNNIDVPQSQIGFLRGFILSTFDILVTMFPSLGFTLDNAKNNIKEWQNLAEQKRKRGWTPIKKDKDKEKDKNNKKV